MNEGLVFEPKEMNDEQKLVVINEYLDVSNYTVSIL